MDKQDVVYILLYIMEYYSTIENNKIPSFVATWVIVEGIIKLVKENQILYDITYMWNLKKYNWQIKKKEADSQI